MSKERGHGKRRLFTLLRLFAAFLMLAWVGKNLPWSDELSLRDSAGEEWTLEGDIDGDWKSDLVRFAPLDPAALDERWPEEARSSVARGEPILAKRREGTQAGFDWHPGMPRAFREMNMSGLFLALALFLLASLTIVTRWWRLLALAGCGTSWFNALRLTFVGLFFNMVMPGATGGDLIKGVVVAKENPGKGAEALVTVVVDRIFGLAALALSALGVILVVPNNPFDDLRTSLLLGLAASALGLLLYTSKGFRRAAGLTALANRLPVAEKLRSLDRAALGYLRQPGEMAIALLLSFVNHTLVTLGVYVLGQALGVPESQVSLSDYFVLVPVANLISAVPLAPGGWGVGELAFRGLFRMIGASPAMGVAISVTFRLSMVGLGLLGGLFLLFPGSRSDLRDARKE